MHLIIKTDGTSVKKKEEPWKASWKEYNSWPQVRELGAYILTLTFA
jgi:hypothetical protein